MRLLVLKDFKIEEDEMNELERQFTDLYYEYTGITPTFYIEPTDYSSVPTESDSDGDLKPTFAYRKELTDDVFKRYNEFGTDHIILLVHQDNWVFKGIWGTNWSNIHHSYQVELCRFDKRNMANSLGTLYHEVMHSHDALIKTTIGVDIHRELGFNWDKFCVHGGRPDKEFTTEWKYIRHKENTSALEYIASYLVASYQKRQALHDKHVGMMKQVITLAQKYILLWKAVHNKKDGVPR